MGEYADRDMDADDLGEWPDEEPGEQQAGAQQPGQASAGSLLLGDYVRSSAELADGDWVGRERWHGRDWLLERRMYQGGVEVDRIGYLPAGIVSMVVSPGGTGKTAAMIQLAMAVATGRDWLGHHVARPGKVLLALGEESADELARRMHAAGQALGLDAADRQAVYANMHVLTAYGVNAAFLSSIKGGDVGPSPGFLSLLERLEADGPWSLIILDPLSMFSGLKDENDNAGMNKLVCQIRRLTLLPGTPNVMLAHHTNKSAIFNEHNQASSRGASSLPDGVRWMASLERLRVRGEADGTGRNLVLLRLHKANNNSPVRDLLFEIGHTGQPFHISPAEHAELLDASLELTVREEVRMKAKIEAIRADEKRKIDEEQKAAEGAPGGTTAQRQGGKGSKATADDGIER